MKMSYIAFAFAVVALVATAAYKDAWVAAGVFAFVGVICLWVEHRRSPFKVWKCACGLINSESVTVCPSCGRARP